MTKSKKLILIMLLLLILVILPFDLALSNKPILAHYSFSKVFYDKHDRVLRITLSNDEKYRIYTPLNQISDVFKDAVLTYEDKYFYHHIGVNPVSLVQAFYQSYITKKSHVGASTITMQLARKLYDIDSRHIRGKMWQIIQAIKLECLYSKDQILEAYLNITPYGYNIEGVGGASIIYFKKKPKDLGMIRTLNLITIPQNPNKRTVQNDKNEQVKQYVFQQLLKKYPQYKDKENLVKIALKLERHLDFYAPHFTDYLDQKYRYRQQFQTTLDLHKQLLLEDITRSYVTRHESLGVNNAAALLLNWQNMEIEAYVGSKDYFDDSIHGQVNGVEAMRSPGSSFKPFIYALALQEGIIHPMSLLKDSPVRYSSYSPSNFDKKFVGPILAKDALIYSRNVPAVNVMLQLQEKSFYQLLQEAKVKHLKSEEYYGLALALGAFEVSMVTSAKLYAMLRNYGQLQDVKYLQDESSKKMSVISKEAAFLTLDILRQNPRPSDINQAFLQQEPNYVTYWKTGTSYAFKDAWSVGVFGPYVLAVWVGNFDAVGNNAFVGRKIAAPLFFEIADNLAKRQDNFAGYYMNSHGLNVTQVDICQDTGDLPGVFCPHLVKSWFILGVSTIKTSNVYRKVFIDKKTGLRACYDDPKTTDSVIYEFWDSDIKEMFENAGIYKKSPPPFMPQCSLVETSTFGKAPQIFLPVSNVLYVIDQNMQDNHIPLKALVDNDAKKLFWFVDNKLIGTSTSDETIYWQNPTSGNATIKVVDEIGRSTTREITIVVK